MIYSSIFLSGLLIIYYIIFIMLYNLFIVLIKIIYIYMRRKVQSKEDVKKKNPWDSKLVHLLL